MFNGELTGDPRRARAERQTSGQLLQAHTRSHEHQIGDVDAPDQQHECCAAPHQIQDRPNVLHHLVLQTNDHRVEASVDEDLFELRESLEVRRVQRVDLALRLLDGGIRFQSRDEHGIVAVPLLVGSLLRRERHRRPHRLVVIVRPETRRHDADDGVGPAVDAKLAADRMSIAAELAAPEPIAQHHDRLTTRLAFLRGERAADLRRHTSDLEERRGHRGRLNSSRNTSLIDAAVVVPEHRLRLECRDVSQSIEVVGHGTADWFGHARAGIRIARHDDAIGFG